MVHAGVTCWRHRPSFLTMMNDVIDMLCCVDLVRFSLLDDHRNQFHLGMINNALHRHQLSS